MTTQRIRIAETGRTILLLLGEKAGIRAGVRLISSQISRPLHTWAMSDINRARALRQKPTWAEKLVWSWLRLTLALTLTLTPRRGNSYQRFSEVRKLAV